MKISVFLIIALVLFAAMINVASASSTPAVEIGYPIVVPMPAPPTQNLAGGSDRPLAFKKDSGAAPMQEGRRGTRVFSTTANLVESEDPVVVPIPGPSADQKLAGGSGTLRGGQPLALTKEGRKVLPYGGASLETSSRRWRRSRDEGVHGLAAGTGKRPRREEEEEEEEKMFGAVGGGCITQEECILKKVICFKVCAANYTEQPPACTIKCVKCIPTC